MSQKRYLVGLFLGLVCGLVAAELPATPETLVAQLASPRFQEREQATLALDALGAEALPALRAALARSDDAELTQRAERLVYQITQRIENARIIAPTEVSLSVKETPLVQVLAELEQQTGYHFYFPTDTAPGLRTLRVTINTNGKVPFWMGMEQVCTAAKMSVIGTGLPINDTRQAATTGIQINAAGAVVPVAQQVSHATTGFTRAVPADLVLPKPDPALKEEAAKQAKMEQAAKDAEAFLQAFQRKGAQAVFPGLPAAPAPAAPPAQNQKEAEKRRLLALAQAAEARSRQASIQQSALTSILLMPETDEPKNPRSLETGIRVEALADIGELRSAQPKTTVLALLQATPEPRLALERVEDVRVTRATTADNLTLVSNMLPVQPAMGTLTRTVMVNQQVRVIAAPVNSRTTQGTVIKGVGPRQWLVRLQGDKNPPDKLAELSGVLVGMLRTSPAEIVSATNLFPEGGPETHQGHGGTLLQAHVSDENIDNTFTLQIQLTYALGRVTPAQNGRDEAMLLAQIQQALDPTNTNPPTETGVLYSGLLLTDRQGQPYRIRPSSSRTSLINQNGERIYVRTMRVTAVPTKPNQEAPAKLGYYGTWLQQVEVPFTLRDVPVATGTSH